MQLYEMHGQNLFTNVYLLKTIYANTIIAIPSETIQDDSGSVHREK